MNYPCPYCTYFTIREWSLDKHVRKMHPTQKWPPPKTHTAQANETVQAFAEPTAMVTGTVTPSIDTETENDLE